MNSWLMFLLILIMLYWFDWKSKVNIALTSQNDLCPYKVKLGIPTTYPMIKVFFIRKMAIFFSAKHRCHDEVQLSVAAWSPLFATFLF